MPLRGSKRFHYEEHGQGKPLVVLNGIMMSCSELGGVRGALLGSNSHLILLDFPGPGAVRPDARNPMSRPSRRRWSRGLLDHLGLKKACIMGISYGGEVAQQFAVKYGAYVDRLVLFNTTARTGPWLGDIGDGWNSGGQGIRTPTTSPRSP